MQPAARLMSALAFAALAGCGDDAARPDAAPAIDAAVDAPPDADPLKPMTLAATGLCLDAKCAQISASVYEYVPRFPLWADTATKRRWMALPANTQIDTTDPDHWVFPKGTRFWKEFTRDGVRVETRFISKVLDDDEAPGAWFYAAFAWNATQDASALVPEGQENANGTAHDIPSRADCRGCHDNLRPSRILGFGAVQLDVGGVPADSRAAEGPRGSSKRTDANGLLDLDRVAQLGWLSKPLPAKTGGAYYPFPADATAGQRDALGYFHANCGHCHNPTSAVHMSQPIELRIDTTKLGSVAATPAYTTTRNVDATVTFAQGGVDYTKIAIPQDAAHSALSARVNSLGTFHMPRLGSEMIDPAAQAAVAAWIDAL